MRNGFFEALLGLAGDDDRIELVVADLGFKVVEPFVERFPARFHVDGRSIDDVRLEYKAGAAGDGHRRLDIAQAQRRAARR